MTDQKEPEELSDDDLAAVQGAGTAVGNPGKKDKGTVAGLRTDDAIAYAKDDAATPNGIIPAQQAGKVG